MKRTGVADEAVEAKHGECSFFDILVRFENGHKMVEQTHARCSPYPRVRKEREHVYEPCRGHEAHRVQLLVAAAQALCKTLKH